MKLFVDSGHMAPLLQQLAMDDIQGATTNPTLMRQGGVTDYEAFARELLANAPPDKPISFEVFARTFDEMERQARLITDWGDNVYVKIPVTDIDGNPSFDLVGLLSRIGVKLNVTAIFTEDQIKGVLRALENGSPAIVSVFAGRIADTGRDPIPHMRMAKELCDLANVHGGNSNIEHLARALGKKFNIPTACMRYTYVQGTRNSFYNAYSGIARISALRLLHGKPPLVFEDGLQQRDFINVADAAQANVIAFENSQADHQVLNVGGGTKYTVLDFAKTIIKVFGKESEFEPAITGEFRVGDTRHTINDNSKMEALGWKQTKKLDETLTEYRDYLENFGDEISAYFEQAEAEMRRKGVIQSVKRSN